MFQRCSHLTNVTIPNSVTKIANFTFLECTGLNSITIPNSVTSIGDGAFSDCSALHSVNMPTNSLTAIGASAFANCYSLTSVTIPGSVTSIGSFAFGGCDGLTSIDIPNSVTNIGDAAFASCYGLTSITIGYNVATIGSNPFRACYNLNTLQVESGNINYDSRNGCNAIIETETNTLIAGCKNTIIPNTVKHIGNYAFNNCPFSNIIIPNSVTSIGNYSFSYCQKLKNITIPNSVASIGMSAFYYCKSLESVTSLITTPFTLGSRTFVLSDSTATKYETLYVPVGTKALYEATDGWNKFNNIVEMEPAGLQDGDTFTEADITYQVISASEKTAQLKRGADVSGVVNIPSEVNGFTVTAIGKAAFRELRNITAVTIPNSVVTMERSVFDDCSNLISVSIPGSVTSIGVRLFTGCQKLTSVMVANDNPVYDSRNNCNAIIETATNKLIVGSIASVIPESVVTIGPRAFEDIRGMVSVVIPEGVTGIEELAFVDCSDLKEVTLPSTLASISMNAFLECPSITKVTSLITTPFAIDKWTFGIEDSNYADYFNPVVYNTATLYVPAGTSALYQATDGWNLFANIEEVVEDEPEIIPTDISQLDNVIYIEPTAGLTGTTIDLCVKLKNSLISVGCTFKLTLPEGLQLQKDEDGDVVYQLSSRAKKMSLTWQDWNNGTYDFALTPSTGTATISGSDDVVVTFKLPIPEDMVEGDYALKLTKCLIQSKVDGTTTDYPLSDLVTTLTVEDYVIGDVNGDRKVTPSDAIMILYHYFDVEQTGFNVKAADVNGYGGVTPADAIEALYIYFNDGSQSNARQMQKTLDPQ